MIWDYFKILSLVVASIALYFNIISIFKKVHKGEETFNDTLIGSALLVYIVLCFYMPIQDIFKII